jgi:hypothetical protein
LDGLTGSDPVHINRWARLRSASFTMNKSLS